MFHFGCVLLVLTDLYQNTGMNDFQHIGTIGNTYNSGPYKKTTTAALFLTLSIGSTD